jgi:transcriptional regulator with XRE-family HTH domain
MHQITAPQIRAARALLGMTQGHLAKLTDMSSQTVRLVERGGYKPSPWAPINARAETIFRIVAELEARGVKFMSQGGVMLEQRKRTGVTLPRDDRERNYVAAVV